MALRPSFAFALFTSCVLPLGPLACSSSSTETPGPDAGGGDGQAPEAGPPPASCDGGTCIQHVVIIVQENHTFDTHFGAYCTAAPGSNPTCNDGPACCEAMPATDPSGNKPVVLTDAEHSTWDPDHEQACELAEMDNGKMDAYVTAEAGASCASPENVAASDPAIVKPYWDLAGIGALADRYFQPVVGQSSSNDMYFARAHFVFLDNTYSAQGAVGTGCNAEPPGIQYTDTTIGDLLTAASVPWAWFADGYQAMSAANGSCPPKPADCAFPFAFYPCGFESGDVPFQYYKSTVDNAANMKDTSALDAALKSGTGLPAVSFVKAIGYKSEHPGHNIKLSAGVTWASALIQEIESSPYAASTLVLLTYDEGGGYFDHVTPPGVSPIDNEPYGTRVPLLAVGPFARKNYVSHAVMEHSSIVKFIEWNFLGGKTGQLGTRDTVVNNIGSMLDPRTTGLTVPEN